MSDPSLLISHILNQTRQNIDLLLSQNQISYSDAQLILAKIPKSPSAAPPYNTGILTPPLSADTPTVPSRVVQYAHADWPYNLNDLEHNDLSFDTGDIIEIVSFMNADWWSGRIRGRQGLFPSNHVHLLPKSTDPTASPRPLPHAAKPEPSPAPKAPQTPVPHPPSYVSATNVVASPSPTPLRPPQSGDAYNHRLSTYGQPWYPGSTTFAPVTPYQPSATPPTKRPDPPAFLRPGHS